MLILFLWHVTLLLVLAREKKDDGRTPMPKGLGQVDGQSVMMPTS